MDSLDGFDFWLVILKHDGFCGSFQFELAFSGLISLVQLGVGSVHIWFFQLSWSILLGFCSAILLVTVSSSTCMWFGWNMISSSAWIKKMLEVSNKGPEWKYQFVLSLCSRLSKFDLAINYLVTILFQEVWFWYLAACIFQFANISPSSK